MSSSPVSQDNMPSFWTSVADSAVFIGQSSLSSARSLSDISATSVESSVESVHWMIRNRGGMAFVTGLALVPSQFGPRAADHQRAIDEAAFGAPFKIEKFSVKVADDYIISGVVYYPPGWDPVNKSKCVAFHNPNGATIADFFDNHMLTWTPGAIADLRECPIVMYDYRGTGISQHHVMSSIQFRPTYSTVVEDGVAALEYACQNFHHVEVWGSSLGGGVSAKALDAHLEKYPADVRRVKLTNHDSFTKTSRVVIPSWPRTADWLTWGVGGYIDGETSLVRVANKGVQVTVLCHTNDPVIPAGSRMAESVSAAQLRDRVRIICVEGYRHASLTQDMVAQLRSV